MEWKTLFGALINTVIVMGLVQLIKIYIPKINLAIPWLLPLLAAVIGPIVALIQTAIAGWLGVPIDLSALVAVFTGGSAVALYQIGKQTHKEA